MKKLLKLGALLALALMLFTGCAGKTEPTQPMEETVEYSNLTDEASRGLLEEAFISAGIPENRIQNLMTRVDRFNASVKTEWLTNGFETAPASFTKYDPYAMQDEWMAQNGSFPGYNCRITAFGLLGSSVTVAPDAPATQGEDFLFLDLETLKQDEAVLCGESQAKFCALFAPVAAADSTKTEDQVRAMQEGWAQRGIGFSEGQGSLITVIFHDRFSEDAGTLSVGHTGVLFPGKDGGLLFIEKVAFQEPYRLLKFRDRQALSDYLMEKYDTAWGQDTTRPFVMENGALMEGFRPNPLLSEEG